MSEKIINPSEVTQRFSKEMQGVAKKVDKLIEEAAGKRVAFSLIVYTPGRAWAIEQIEFMLACWKEGMPDTPAHEVN